MVQKTVTDDRDVNEMFETLYEQESESETIR